MKDDDQLPLIDAVQLKRQIAEAVRTTIRELARERGMSVGNFVDSLVSADDRTAVREQRDKT